MQPKVYIHELIDIIGQNRARYMQHMTANWCPTARAERNQLCFGVWGTVGSTGDWPQVVNLWELDGWDGLVGNFEHELSHDSLQDPALAEWWATAAQFRRGGVDRIVEAWPGMRSIEQLVADGVRGEVYAHELVTVPPGRSPELLAAVVDEGRRALEEVGATLVGAFRVTMVNDTEAVAIWAFPDYGTWAAREQADTPTGALSGWRARLIGLDAHVRRTLMVDAPLCPLRTGRQPQVEDRVPLDDL